MAGPVVTDLGDREPRPRPLLRTKLGDVLRRARLAQRRTLADVARHANISMPYLSELERGRKEASSEVLAAVCEALRIDLPEVLAEVGRALAEERVRPASVIRLDVIRTRRMPPGQRRGDAQCLLAA
jgi:transcriptional regulator with XRE-family HTH domain